MIKTGIIDPIGPWVIPYLEFTDFLVVDSIEMKDYWAFSGKPIFDYLEYPNIEPVSKSTKTKTR